MDGLIWEVTKLRQEVASPCKRVELVEGPRAQGRQSGDDGVDMDNVDDGNEGRQRTVAAPRHLFPELFREHSDPDEEQVYGAAAELVVECCQACAELESAL